jgi:hypothetical protein
VEVGPVRSRIPRSKRKVGGVRVFSERRRRRKGTGEGGGEAELVRFAEADEGLGGGDGGEVLGAGGERSEEGGGKG